MFLLQSSPKIYISSFISDRDYYALSANNIKYVIDISEYEQSKPLHFEFNNIGYDTVFMSKERNNRDANFISVCERLCKLIENNISKTMLIFYDRISNITISAILYYLCKQNNSYEKSYSYLLGLDRRARISPEYLNIIKTEFNDNSSLPNSDLENIDKKELENIINDGLDFKLKYLDILSED